MVFFHSASFVDAPLYTSPISILRFVFFSLCHSTNEKHERSDSFVASEALFSVLLFGSIFAAAA